MTCRTWQEELNQCLNEELERRSAAVEGSSEKQLDLEIPDYLRFHASGCPNCARKLARAEDFFRTETPAVPEGLSSRIARQVLEHDEKPSRVGGKRILIPAAAAAAILISWVTITLSLQYNSARTDDTVQVRLFLEAPNALRVEVVGDWNGWDGTENPLTDKDRDGVWETTLRLVPGKEYRYQFLVNGEQWVADPQSSLKIDDGFGGYNSILQL